MRHHKFDLTSIRLFLAASHLGSFAAAAKAVNLVPSAASRRLTEIEEEVGAVLFHRRSTGVVLTSAGAEVQRHFAGLVGSYERMWVALDDLSSGVRGLVRVWATSTSLTNDFSTRLKSFLDQHKNIRVEIEERTDMQVVQSIESGVADLGLFSSHQHSPEIDKVDFSRDRVVVVVPESHPLLSAQKVDFAEIARYEFVGWDDGVALGSMMQSLSASNEIVMKVRLRVRSLGALCSMVKAGLGVGVAPSPQVLGEAAKFGLQTVCIDGEWALRVVYIGFRAQAGLSPASRMLLEHLTGGTQLRATSSGH